jgi:hypothetical protein
MSLELLSAIASVGTFIVIAATAIAVIVQSRYHPSTLLNVSRNLLNSPIAYHAPSALTKHRLSIANISERRATKTPATALCA